jgi:hypothetical protein
MWAAGRCSAPSCLVRRLVGTRSRAIRGSSSDDRVGCSASDGRCAPARPVLQRRCMSRRVFCRFCHARSRVPIVFGPFHDCAFCERATPDAPETIDDQRRCTGCRYRTIYGGSRGSASCHLQLRITSLVACERRTLGSASRSASLPPLASRLPICRRLGDLFRCLHHDLKWNFCQTPKIRMFVELRLVKEWRAHSAAKAGDLSGRRQRLSLLLK